MNFKELFAKLPTSTHQDWETAARAQLKGKPLESIDVSLREGAVMSPFSIGTDSSISGGDSQGWIPFSSFSSTDNVSGAMILEALSGGAQGVEIDLENLLNISSELKEVRFDFISLKVNSLSANRQQQLVDLIPEDQRSGARVVVSLGEDDRVNRYGVLISKMGSVEFLLSPKLVVGDQASLKRVFDSVKIALENADDFAIVEYLGVEVFLSPNYLQNITYIHAARLMLANLFYSFGVEQPLPRPYLFGKVRVDAEEESHETYLINATAQSVAGVSGGLDALAIDPYPDTDQNLAARRARNIQNVLAIEGLIGLPVNAIEGAAFFETASKDLVSSIWPVS